MTVMISVRALTVWLALSVFVAADDRTVSVDHLGDHGILFPPDYHKLNYFPDEPPAFLSKNPFRFLLVAGNSTTLMQGPTGITSVYQDKKRILGFYHAEDHVGMPRVPYNEDIQGGYWSIGVAVSRDHSATFGEQKQILRASVPKNKVTNEHQGIGDVSVIPNASKTFLYAYYTDLTRRKEDERAKIGMARCPIGAAAKPSSWQKYFKGEFKERGLGGNESPVVNPPAAFPSEVIGPHVTYVPEWQKYLMVGNVVAYSDIEKQKGEQGGLFLCQSSDGIEWTEPKVLVVGLSVPHKDREYVAHPRLYLEKVEANRAEGWLMYCYSPSWGQPKDGRIPHHLARRHIVLSIAK
ncbi:MAG TPA: hypothetical protein VMV69_30130 [Pirellulales bacterium]|nr:hypothetical protein [Pirellulales bacterium]